ncbi:Trypsin-1 [Orchesella cincta]|uniref:Phenoloxidase-activating factor 2 n=1 Tax=Orchesella cincta TaxID=48709 RepID=A0A1D2N2F5_ORCCI|nr:Trypsin-1 [Orchesella cincta]
MILILVKQVLNSTIIKANSTTNNAIRIVGGVETARNEFPFIVSFARHGRHFCGGSVIAPEWVLTAAHCASEADFSVTAGEHDLHKNEGSEQVSRSMNVIRHPHYNPITYEDDICLVKVSPPFAFTTFVQPFSIPSTHYIANGEATVAGWGTEDEAFQQVSPVLRKVTVPLVESLECAKEYGRNFVPHKMICAGEEEGGKDACQGDSGGPLMCDDYHKGATLCGVVSFGLGCARPELAGVYTKVAYYSDWIDFEIKKNSDPNAKNPITRPTRPTPTKTTPRPNIPAYTIPSNPEVVYVIINRTDHRNPRRPYSGSTTIRVTQSIIGISLVFLILNLF